ncbi:LCP family protein [Kitasatospora sp. NBC_01302]|uniref:LCP family protein n=1 Tax=Kitasatospora sp. NBC_01302 TaxID=2903575 RepID=UPI002E0E8AA2|nr:LCP family protein [Kitasatospora sp. NBC_01302]
MGDHQPSRDGADQVTKQRRRRRRIVLWLGVPLALLLGAGAYVYVDLDGNIRSSALFSGTGGQAPETKDAAGRSPENILVIGSDTRDSAADCAIGGDCGPGANADVEMLVHLAADRTNATVLSIPRDVVMSLPGCTDPTTGQVHPGAGQAVITSSLQYGPGCTVAAVHQLTGITIDHFMMIDFSGVVNMSDAVGGVRVCVDNNVYDPDSHLKLTAGTHTLQGLAALEFLRTRHGFGDGSDLGREDAQHIFLSAMVQKLKSAGTLTNPVTLYSLASAATKALTVDPALNGLADLADLANQLNDVPTNRITFLTTPNSPYTGADPVFAQDLVPAPGASAVFRAILADRSFSGTGSPATAPPSTPPNAGKAADAVHTTAPQSAPPATAPTTAPGDTNALNAAAAPGCAKVSTEDTTAFGSPVQAFAQNPDVPNSAP